ncbi:MAG: thioesterase family protein [Kordiimonadaceae bacterium]|nr:thioesterase family protein [Kordiimonadaceae bacterium]
MGNLNEQSANTDVSEGVYKIEIHKDWEIWGPNGGYLAACILRAVGSFSEHARPISYFGQYLRVAKFGDAEVHIECSKRGRAASAYSAKLLQDGKVMLQAMIWTGPEGEGLSHQYFPAPKHFTPLDENAESPPVGPFAFWENFDISKSKTGDGYFSQWYKYLPEISVPDAYIDAARSLILIDTMQWPAAWNAHDEPAYVAPSLDLSVRFHCNGQNSQWLYCDAVADIGEGGLLAGSASVWDENGKLIASGGSQSLCLPYKA